MVLRTEIYSWPGKLMSKGIVSASSLRRMGVWTVVLHAIVNVVHGAAHNSLSILMLPWQNVYIFVVIFALPLVAGVLLWRGSRMGFVLLLVSMLGSLLFGGYYHFVLPGPDHVSHLMPHVWTVPFQVSAVLLAITEATGVIVGALGLRLER